ncbi:LacI family DNA-binding transcriptional regulator [Kineococcus sp. LSe6-4]|uniref:LacI family DNA-binding transcriptional regulator n=1 Tax=Kineococcus halophytocola TaxID=3234027 RepID=A0ABV4H1F9_9ACTN
MTSNAMLVPVTTVPPTLPPSGRPAGSTVARLAGVSQKTVSRVFNDEPYVSAEVRERVLRAAEQLGYRPNSAARALTSGRTRRLGVVWLGSALYGPAQMLVGLERAARDLGYSVSLAATTQGETGSVDAAIGSLLSQGVDGILLSEPVDDQPQLRLTSQVPVVSLGRLTTASGTDVEIATQDWAAAAALATRHLLDLGHRTVHHVRGPQTWWAARDRERGWRQALHETGREVPPPLQGDWTAASGYAAGRAVLGRPEVTAVFAANDEMALGVVRAQLEAGRDVPGDLSVVGFDDVPSAAFFTPPLTTIRQDFDTDVHTAVERLVARIEDRAVAADATGWHPELVVRSSTAAPRT